MVMIINLTDSSCVVNVIGNYSIMLKEKKVRESDMQRRLIIDYEEFEEEGTAALTISENGEALWMFTDDDAKTVLNALLGEESEEEEE
jgi:hypothetical protein